MSGTLTIAMAFVGLALIVAGAMLAILDWNKKRGFTPKTKSDNLGETLNALAKVLEALKGYQLGQFLIIAGIIVLFLAALFAGLALP